MEDNPPDAELILQHLRKDGFDPDCTIVRSAEQLRATLRLVTPDIILADYNLGHWRGTEALEILRQEGMDVPLILVTGALGDVTAVDCIKQGATDYVLKDAMARLPTAIRRVLHERQLREQRRGAEQELGRSVRELERSNHDLEQFAYVASHDLQEPLRMVATYSQLLADKYRGQLDSEADHYIHYVVDGATRMQTLIQDLLAFSRAGREGMEMSNVDTFTLVQQALLNLQGMVNETNARITYAGLPVIPANPTQLRQVFQNVIGNALKFQAHGPPAVRITARRKGPDWLFSVADNGIGIPLEQLENIFVAFRRLHAREEYPGNGIGLAICKKIVERHGGRIWAESEAGVGTTMHFTLPATPSSEAESHGNRLEQTNHGRGAAGDNSLADTDLTYTTHGSQKPLIKLIEEVADSVSEQAMAALRKPQTGDSPLGR